MNVDIRAVNSVIRLKYWVIVEDFISLKLGSNRILFKINRILYKTNV